MKKTVKIGFLLLILGLILAILGIANNGIKTIYWHDGFHIAKRYTASAQPTKIKSITLKTGSNVIVRSGDHNSIRVTSSIDQPQITDNDGRITVTSSVKSYQSFNFQFTTPVNEATVITVAKGTKLDQLTAGRAQNGDVSLNSLNIGKLTAQPQGDLTLREVNVTQPLTDITAYNTRFNKVTAPSLTLKSTGDITIDHSQFEKSASSITGNDDVTIRQTKLRSGQINGSDSDISLLDNQLAQQLAVKTTDGDIHVTTAPSSGINAHTDDGDLTVFSWHHDNQKSYQYQPKANQQYQLTTTDGDITVTAS